MKRASAAIRSATCVALMSVTATGLADEAAEREVSFKTSDGWQIKGLLHVPQREGKASGVVFVHASRHESDAYGNLSAPGIPQTLSRAGIATLRIDIRGRGASREPRVFNSLAPAERDGVRFDVAAAIEFLAAQPGIDVRRMGIVAEQDSADAALLAAARDKRVAAFILISGRLGDEAKKAMTSSNAPVYCLVSKEDRRGFQDMTDVYLASKNRHSRLRVFEGLAMGTTMFSTWRFERANEPPIDEIAAEWMAERLKTATSAGAKRGKKR